MRWSIRNQILLPFALIQTLAITVLSVILAMRATQSAEQDAERRLEAVVQTLSNARFPLHTTILEQMKGLSTADFVTADSAGRLVATTLGDSIAREVLRLTAAPDSQAFSGPISEFIPVTVQEDRFLVGHANIMKTSNAAELLVLVPEQQWNAVTQASMWPPLLIGGAALPVMVSVSAWISARFAGRIRRLQGQVKRIAEGHFQETIPEAGADELGELAISIQRMASDLQTLTQQIRTNERVAIVTQVAGGLAHQLRNSITGARMAVQLHDRRCSHNDKESLQVALRQLSLTESQIRGLLTLTSDLHQPPKSGLLNDVVDSVRNLVLPECEHLQIRLTVANTPSSARVKDVEQMEAGILNVVRNAMEAAGPAGEVEMHATVDQGLIRIDVLNSGPPISAEIAASMFEPFASSKSEGVGLGLTLAARTAEIHGGHLTHQRAGNRTCFRFEIAEDLL